MLSKLRNRVNEMMEPFAKAFIRAGLTPNIITLMGVFSGIVTAILFGYGMQILAGISLLICGFFDLMDGLVARTSGKQTAFGGILDSVADRYVEFLIFAGIILASTEGKIAEAGFLPNWGWGILALTGSFMVSYVRARAEAAGVNKLDVGIAERGERLIILIIGAFIGYIQYALVLITILTHITIAQRILIARLLLPSWRV